MANAVNKEPAGKYCVSVAETAVRYTSNANQWTPNNIKRLIISPDMVVVQLHVGGTFIKKNLLPNKYAECVMDAKYSPMVSVLGGNGNNVCSHVEEIVYCLQGVNGGGLHQMESDLRAIVSSQKSTRDENELKKVIGDRFKRLYAVVYFSGNIQQLMQGVQQKVVRDPAYHIADEQIGGIRSVLIHKDDWYKGHFFRPTIYPADADGGALHKKIMGLMQKIDAEKQKEKSEKARADRLGDLEEKAKKELSNFKITFKACQRLYIMLSKEDSKSVFARELESELSSTQETLLKGVSGYGGLNDVLGVVTDGLKEDLARSGVRVEKDKSKGDEKALAEAEVAWFKAQALSCYSCLQSFYLKVLNSMNDKHKLFTKCFTDHNDLTVMLVGNANKGGLNVEFKKANLEKSVITMCQHISSIMLKDHSFSKYTTSEYWSNFVEKAK